jgi:IMP dehydrogenase
MSFIAERVQIEGLTFDDVLLVPAYSDVLPREVNLSTRFSRRIELKIPITSLQLFPTAIDVTAPLDQRSS